MMEQYLDARCVTFDLQADTKDDAIRELAHLLTEAGYVNDEEAYAEAVLYRETIDTTGMGDGFAIPHGKSDAVNRATVAFGRTSKGYEWNSLDGAPVTDIFLLAVPVEGNAEHLQMLSTLARKLMHQDVRDALHNAQSAEALYQALD